MRAPPAACLALILLTACADVPSDETPSGALRLFVDAMERSDGDPEALRDAYALMAAPSRRALQERAHLAASLGGREFQPWEMLVRSRFRRSFAFRDRAMREVIDGDHATVTVRSEDGQRSAQVPLERENGRWRVLVEIPPARE
ncbi:MAG: hypothetical protein KC619_20170 [Myxococcales bacterium]|nr:hypothetical protein [Myxococcales bacterium]